MYNHESIRAVLFQDGAVWAAQCLEHDIGSQGATPEEASAELEVVLALELAESLRRGGLPFDGIDPAPKEFFDLWENATADRRTSPVKADDTEIAISYAQAA